VAEKLRPTDTIIVVTPIDTTKIDQFFAKYPLFEVYKNDVKLLYRKNPIFIWHKGTELIEFAHVLYNQASQLDREGLKMQIPYSENFEVIFYKANGVKMSPDSEFLSSSLLFYYIRHVYECVNDAQRPEMHWYIPRE